MSAATSGDAGHEGPSLGVTALGYELHHVQLAMPVGAEDAARSFYAGVLGMTEVTKPPALAARGGVWFRGHRLELHLGVEQPFRPAAKAHPGIEVDDESALDALAGRLRDAGIDPRPEDLFPGYRRFYVDDCFGNRLEFMAQTSAAPTDQPMPDAEGGPLPVEPDLTGGSVRLRRWAMSDLACVEAASREGRIPHGTTVPAVFSEEAGHAWIRRQHARRDAGQGWSLAVCDADTDRAMGCVVLLLRPQDGVAGLGYWLAPDDRGRGHATSAVRLITAWGLQHVGLARVEAWVEPHNTRSIAVLARGGFAHEGRLRAFLAIPPGRSDALVYSRITE